MVVRQDNAYVYDDDVSGATFKKMEMQVVRAQAHALHPVPPAWRVMTPMGCSGRGP